MTVDHDTRDCGACNRSTAYRNGCRCLMCKEHNKRRQQDYQARRRSPNVVALPKTRPISPSGDIGENELAVIEHCALMPKSAELPSIVAQAKTLARILDDPDLMSCHANTSRQLQSLLATLTGPPKKSRGRLASIQAMTNQRRQA